jgi:hypothetical protein
MLVKYSFAPVAFVAVARRRWTVLAVAGAMEALGVAVFCVLTGSSVLSAVVSPLRAAERTQPIASGDFLTLTRLVTHDELLGFAVAIGACVVLTWCARRVLSGPHWVDALSAGALVSLLVFPHLVYDYCFLLPVVGSALRREWRPRLALITPVAFLWYDWLLPHRLMTPYRLPAVIVTLLMLLLVLVVLVRTAALPASAEQGEPSATGAPAPRPGRTPSG